MGVSPYTSAAVEGDAVNRLEPLPGMRGEPEGIDITVFDEAKAGL